jgi:Ulp1 family protease
VGTVTTEHNAQFACFSGKDINTLRGLTWLNDEIINFYMQASSNQIFLVAVFN